MHGVKLDRLVQGSEKDAVPLSLFRMEPAIPGGLLSCLENLAVLDLNYCLGCGCSLFEASAHLAAFLARLQSIQRFFLCGGHHLRSKGLCGLFKKVCWPQLSPPELGNIQLDADDLFSITRSHAPSLKEVKFFSLKVQTISHRTIRRPVQWEETWQTLSEYLQLQCITICDLDVKIVRHIREPQGERLLELADLVMSGVDKQRVRRYWRCDTAVVTLATGDPEMELREKRLLAGSSDWVLAE